MVAYATGDSRCGIIEMGYNRNRDGHREYTLKTRVRVTDPRYDGPQIVMSAVGLPAIGSYWAFGNDVDPWAFCLPTASCTPCIKGEPSRFWEVTQTFSTLPMTCCRDSQIEDPLLEPPRIGGSFSRYTKEVFKDVNGDDIKSSSHERIFGLERDYNTPSVQISLNYISVDMDLVSRMINTVNESELWGCDARTIKLCDVSWSRSLYGQCIWYYTINYSFEINWKTWDLTEVVDTGYKVYNDIPGNSRDNPDHFVAALDAHDQPERQKIFLDGNGDRSEEPVNLPTIELYEESNFLLLGIPSAL